MSTQDKNIIQSLTINETIKRIHKCEILLPSMQRKFVWTEDKIIKLFDSIMRGYPFGNFLFWSIDDKDKIDEYHFYEFIKDFSLRDNTINPIAIPDDDVLNVVMDGQQRLTSLYIGILGSLETIEKHKKRNIAENWKKKRLYIKPFIPVAERADDELPYKFEFLSDEEVATLNEGKNKNELYYRVSDFYNCSKEKLREKLEVGQIRNKEEDWKYILENLRYSINDACILPVHSIKNKEIADVLEIFKRINSGGTPLSPSNLLFSTIITSWEQGREEMDNFISSINKEHIITIKEDFLIRACLYLINQPASAKIGILKKDVVNEIKDNWNRIKNAIFSVKNFLVRSNIYEEAIISYNALLPIAYYYYHSKNDNQKANDEQLFNYFAVAQMFSLFGGSSDTTLEQVRRSMCKPDLIGELKEPFNIKNLFNIDLSAGRLNAFKITRENVEKLVDSVKYGDKKTYTLLCLLQPGIVINKKEGNYYDVDHVCPKKEFNNIKGLSREEKHVLKTDAYKLSNLQLLEAGKNRGEKNDDSLYEWKIMKHNSIPFDPFENETDLDKYIIDSKEKFYAFYNARREMIINYLCERFSVEK